MCVKRFLCWISDRAAPVYHGVGGRPRPTSQTKDNLVWPPKDVIDNWINIDLLRQGKHWWTSKHGGRMWGGDGGYGGGEFGQFWNQPASEALPGWTSTPVNLQCYFNVNLHPHSKCNFRPKSRWVGVWNVPIFLLFLDISTSCVTQNNQSL